MKKILFAVLVISALILAACNLNIEAAPQPTTTAPYEVVVSAHLYDTLGEAGGIATGDVLTLDLQAHQPFDLKVFVDQQEIAEYSRTVTTASIFKPLFRNAEIATIEVCGQTIEVLINKEVSKIINCKKINTPLTKQTVLGTVQWTGVGFSMVLRNSPAAGQSQDKISYSVWPKNAAGPICQGILEEIDTDIEVCSVNFPFDPTNPLTIFVMDKKFEVSESFIMPFPLIEFLH